MTQWDYKIVVVSRTGSHEGFGSEWTYTPWELTRTDPTHTQPMDSGLQQLGFEGWELAAVLPTDLWSEGTRMQAASHGIRTITSTLIFKRPIVP